MPANIECGDHFTIRGLSMLNTKFGCRRASLSYVALLIWMGCCAGNSYAQYPYGMVCAPGMDGCAPRRETYGYYQTSWRQWPAQKPTVAAPKAETIPTPTPATPKKAEPETA